ncbi:ABC transporter permease [Microbacterium sp. MPKO10]|uniref:ABC transporter permease n=1 Tax=Microbacterium sp. MPKO10 TaxID=2989818 RepID=UPI0022361D00|nr:ABC transporter permease [Microbacterium sp. MPKO10]MCW4456840.1 ABC transporter permease [Microbacterium sp. MPKO10]
MVAKEMNKQDVGATVERKVGWAVITPAAIIVLVFFITPVLYFLRIGFETPSQSQISVPGFTLNNFGEFFQSAFYVHTLIRTVLIALCSTALCLVLALPVANLITRSSRKVKSLLIIATVFPLLVGNVVRSIGWVALLGYDGAVNSILIALGVVEEPLELLHSPVTVGIAITSVVLPIMVLTLQASMEAVSPATEQAALSLGAPPMRVFRQITFPQMMPGVVAGTSLVFVLCMNSYATPLLIGGSQVPMLAPAIYSAITTTNNWPFGAAMATTLLVVCLTVIVLYGRLLSRIFETWRKEPR